MLPAVFQEFEMVYLFIYFAILLFSLLSLSTVKRSTLAKIWGDCNPPAPSDPTWFL